MNPVRLFQFWILAGATLLLTACVVEPVGYAPPPRPIVRAVLVVDAPPPLPIYDIPPCPGEGLHWIPGYWAWNDLGYYWVPGTWVAPPRPGVVWTPGYWSFEVGGRYAFHDGYWGARVGFYGGINYGGGYVGTGFVGGRWDGGAWRVNSAVYNVTNVRNVYRETVINNVTVNNVTVNNNTRVSYSGGQGGTRVMPTPQEREVERLPHFAATDQQVSHVRQASSVPELQMRQNQGRPAVGATATPGAIHTLPQRIAEPDRLPPPPDRTANRPAEPPAERPQERAVDRPANPPIDRPVTRTAPVVEHRQPAEKPAKPQKAKKESQRRSARKDEEERR